MVQSTVLQLLAYSGPELRLAPRLWKSDSGAMTVVGGHTLILDFFFHEYGRRVGMVPRSSLKEGKNRQMVEKGTKAPKPTQTKHPSPQAETPPSCSLPSTLGETCETETSGN